MEQTSLDLCGWGEEGGCGRLGGVGEGHGQAKILVGTQAFQKLL